jgi:hypothetical protein
VKESRVGFLIGRYDNIAFQEGNYQNMVKVQQKFYQTKCDVNQFRLSTGIFNTRVLFKIVDKKTF